MAARSTRAGSSCTMAFSAARRTSTEDTPGRAAMAPSTVLAQPAQSMPAIGSSKVVRRGGEVLAVMCRSLMYPALLDVARRHQRAGAGVGGVALLDLQRRVLDAEPVVQLATDVGKRRVVGGGGGH